MRFALYAVSGLLLTGAGTLAYLGSRPAPLPPPVAAVSIEPAVHDFGDVSHTDVVTATFTVRNTHPVPVTIGQITKGCSCSEAEVTPRTIPSGGVAQLSVTWQLRGKRGRSSEFMSIPYVGPDGLLGSSQAEVRAAVSGGIDPDMEVLELSPTSPRGDVKYTASTGRAFRITAATTSHRSLTGSNFT